MKRKHLFRSVLAALNTLPSMTFISILVISLVAACNIPSNIPQSAQAFSDKNARMYQMYYDSSADPAQNELQVRRFLGHLHLADLEDIFGDIQSLPQDEDCNYVGGPVEYEGLIWYVTVTPDLVGVNLISIAFDGTRSSAFDLDGDRIVDILDIRLSDFRRISFVTEKLGMDVFKYFLQGRNPLCDNELIRQLHLPELGCGETGDGSSGGENGFAPGTNIIDPLDVICSDYDTSPEAGIMTGATRGGPYFAENGVRYLNMQDSATYWAQADDEESWSGRTVETFVEVDAATNETVAVIKTIVDVTYDVSDISTVTGPVPPRVVQIITERVNRNGEGTRTITKYNEDGTVHSRTTEQFNTNQQAAQQGDYDHNESDPPTPQHPDNTTNGGIESNPGRDGDDSSIQEFCRRRANHQSGIEQALADDPTSVGVSCGDVVGAPDNPNCMLIEWATELDFMSVFDMAGDDGNCDPNGERGCEPAGVDEQISRFRGMTAELWSLDLPSINFCPAVVCDPALESAMQTYSYTAGEVEFSCAEIPEEPTLEPSEENCPPGTYYAPVTDRCIQIQIQQAGGNGDGGNGGSSGACNLSTSACTSQGLSFDSVNCACVPIQ